MGAYRIEIVPDRQKLRVLDGDSGALSPGAAVVVLNDVTDYQASAIARRVATYLAKIGWAIPAEGFGDTVEKIAADVKAKTGG
ncbi:hypothetical protein [Mycobacteroides abscessus]|uniref:hypothetical protein n=1 Tax=Mycobacteroides abscessus TaxID=36809 RepID=UPI0007F94C09|nr:hypothetical protein [Mycobacteroides abscessus]ANO12761.1 hypothetical protein BAB77_01870 [Mycobacteroides abscessus]ARQ63013.1 hypothetical protein CAK77_02050 [Mycobacteroides abscessus subsp. massiliense]MBE5447574.1 hypothetical protein [Mycobacteroides abscessus]MBE5514195.1 hypothetical protein [Mycobacteroides abscessus]MBN7511816.1 hypothetical protein [Mycobacteroides abscessus subsp. massiliense]